MAQEPTVDYDSLTTVRVLDETRPDLHLENLSQDVRATLDGLDCSQDWGMLFTAQKDGEITEVWASEWTVAHHGRTVECIVAPTDPATQGCRCCHPGA